MIILICLGNKGPGFATMHPEMLCMKVAGLLADVQGRNCAAAADSAPTRCAARKANQKAATGHQPRAGKFTAVPEYKTQSIET